MTSQVLNLMMGLVAADAVEEAARSSELEN
jgi:hypothetical protein